MQRIVSIAFIALLCIACNNQAKKSVHVSEEVLVPVQNKSNTETPELTTSKEVQPSPENMTNISFTNTMYDFGKISKQKGKVSHWYTFTNDGDQPLMISVKPSCGCTLGSAPKDPILPGQSDSIRLEYDPKNDGGKKITKSATVTGNFEKPVKLNFSAEVLN